MNSEPAQGLARLAVALLVGLLVGLDRERAEARKGYEGFAGVRTFPLIALAGCVAAMLGPDFGAWPMVTGLLTIGAVVVVSYHRHASERKVGATTEVVALVTYLLGALSGTGAVQLAGAAGVAVAVLLVAKPRLEAFSRALQPLEITAALELAVVSVIVLPLLPDRGMGPWGVLNPRDIWWVVVLVAGLSFAGFVAVRLVGEERGLTITGAVGGLVSSTAVTVAMADRSRLEPDLGRPAAAAAVLASTVMAARVLALAGIVNLGMVPALAPTVMAMLLVGALAARLVARERHREATPAGEKIRNPFSLAQAFTFAFVYAIILLLVGAAREWTGGGGLFLVAAVSSVADVDAVTIAVTKIGPGNDAWRTGAAAVGVAVVLNTLVKLAIAASRGSTEFRRPVALSLGAMALAGAVAGVARWLGN